MLLVSGPPGLGKTTLAGIAAKQAGYHPIEINASDERTADSLRTRVLNACEMRGVFTAGKPSVVILDECDGISATGQVPGICLF